MPTTTNMILELPAEDGSSGYWDTLLNAAFAKIDAHDHSSGKGVPVPSAGIDIDADLPFGGFAATGVKAIDFNGVAASTLAGYAQALFVDSANSELYWRTGSGVNVQLTSGASLNSALVGGFTGDYGTGGSQANYSSSSGIFNFLKAATTRAYIDSSDIRLFEATAGITNAVKLKSPAALAASYSLTFPGANPASVTTLPKVSTGGVIAYTGAATHDGNLLQVGTLGVSGATTLSSTLGVTGNTTLGSTLGVTGLITATAGLTAAANQHVTVSGTGRFKHGTETITIAAVTGKTSSPATDALTFGNTQGIGSGLSRSEVVFASGTEKLRIPVTLPAGRRITDCGIAFNGAGASTKRFNMMRETAGSTAVPFTASTINYAPSGAASLTLGLTPYTTIAGEIYFLQFEPGDVGDILYHIIVSYDLP